MAADPNANPESIGEPPRISPIYSIDVHSEAVWCVTGTESGSINLFTVRHEEGKLIHVMRGHQSPVSVLKITPDERGLVSGSWDKSCKVTYTDVDLESG